jgi:hypothetical protein
MTIRPIDTALTLTISQLKRLKTDIMCSRETNESDKEINNTHEQQKTDKGESSSQLKQKYLILLELGMRNVITRKIKTIITM